MSDAAAILPNVMALEPILGVAIALNLAYLNIKKFGYLLQVQRVIKHRLNRLDENVVDAIKDTEWYGQLKSLSDLEINDNSPFKRESYWKNAPESWGVLYNLFFYIPIGRFFSILSTAYCLLLLIAGVGCSINYWSVYSCDYHTYNMFKLYVFSIVSLLWPIIVIIFGELITSKAGKFLSYQTNKLKTKEKEAAVDALETAEQKLGSGPNKRIPKAIGL
jgi:hypothetical protein